MSDEGNKSIIIIPIILSIILFLLKFSVNNNSRDVDIKLNINPADIMLLAPMDGYSGCENSKFPMKCDSIRESWNYFRDKKSDSVDRLMKFSDSHVSKFKELLAHSFYTNESDLLELSITDQIRITSLRSMILSLYKRNELTEKEERNMIAEFFFIQTESDREYSNLKGIKFISENSAYGRYINKGKEKGVHFLKDKNEWKFDLYDEGESYNNSRKELGKEASMKFLKESLRIENNLLIPLK